MNIRHKELEINEDDAFRNCKLERKQYADVLTNIVSSYSDGFVLAINNPWGTGKTTFVKMWQKQLNKEGFKTLYFNAWENDFDTDPLIAIISELKTLTHTVDDSFKALLKCGAKISHKIIPLIAKAIAEKYIETKVFTDAIEKITEATTDIFKDEIVEYTEKKKGLIEFKHELQKFVGNNIDDKPLVFIIDELDRCKPNYAVEVLEKIKHFFNVPGIVFILSIDKIQLVNAVKGYYGSEEINGDEYLRRFIDIEYSLPEPENGLFCAYLYNYFNFDQFFRNPERLKYSELQGDGQSFLKFSTMIFALNSTTLRQQEKIFAHARVTISSFGANSYAFPYALLFLIYTRTFEPKFYNILQTVQLSTQVFINELEKIIPKNLDEEGKRYFLNLEALLVVFYENERYKGDYKSQLIEKDMQTSENNLLVKSSLDDENNIAFKSYVEGFIRKHDRTGIKYLLKKIELLNTIN